MTRLAIATAALLSTLCTAQAADLKTATTTVPVLPVKAPLVPTEFGPGGSGWYLGLGTEAAVTNVNNNSNLLIQGLVTGGVKADGAAITGTIGYISGNPGRWWRCEFQGNYQNITAQAGAASVASRWEFAEGCDVGFEWLARITSAIPNLGITLPTFNPSLPANITVAGTPKQYIGLRAVEQGLQGDFFGVGGSTWVWAPALQTGYFWQTTDPTTGKPNGGALDAYVRVAWPQRGLTIAGVGINGGPPMFQNGSSLGTEYTAGLKYDFGL